MGLYVLGLLVVGGGWGIWGPTWSVLALSVTLVCCALHVLRFELNGRPLVVALSGALLYILMFACVLFVVPPLSDGTWPDSADESGVSVSVVFVSCLLGSRPY